MSERINVDHAFDPEARKAQAELDTYMDSRAFYKDENNKIHNATDGQKFATKEAMDAHYNAVRDGHYDETLQEGDYSNESLEQLAQRVAQARAEGDKTRANDAEEAFFNKFAEYSEKYGWENEDGSANGPHVDKDAKLGRSTIDDRLERYTKVMYGEDVSEARVEEAREEVESAIEQAAETEVEPSEEAAAVATEADESDTEQESDEAEAADEEEKPASVADQFDDLQARLNAQADARVEQVVADMNDTDQAKADRELLNPVSTEGLEPVDGATDEADVELISLEGLESVDGPDDDSDQEDEDGYVKPSLKSRIRSWLTPTGIGANLGALSHSQRERLKERKHGRATMIVGGLAVAGAGIAGYMLLRNGGHDGGGNGGVGNWINDLFGGADEAVKDGGEKAKDAADNKSRGGGSGVNWNDFDPSARNVTNGEGWYSTFQQMGIPKENWSDVLKDAGPKLGRLGEAYYDNSSNEWRISNPGRLSGESLRVIAAAAKRDGVDLAA